MGILGKLCKIFFFTLSACLGLALGIAAFTSLMVVEVESSAMLPTLTPGDRAVVLQESVFYSPLQLDVGDLVVYKAPYYTTDGEGLEKLRRITGMRGSWIRLNCDSETVQNQEILAGREQILGKVILVIPRLELP